LCVCVISAWKGTTACFGNGGTKLRPIGRRRTGVPAENVPREALDLCLCCFITGNKQKSHTTPMSSSTPLSITLTLFLSIFTGLSSFGGLEGSLPRQGCTPV
jgi:hypothetical protein